MPRYISLFFTLYTYTSPSQEEKFLKIILRRFGAEEEKYKSSPHIRPVTKTTLKTSTNGISSSENSTSSRSKTSSKTDESLKKTENGSSASSKTEESLKKTEEDTATSKPKNTEEDKASETTKPKTKIIKKKIVKKPATTTASNGTTTPNKIQEKSELTKSTTSNLKQSDNNDNKLENVPRTYQIVITLSDYMGDEEEGDEDEPFGLDEGQCVEVLDNANPDAWLVRTKV